MVETCPPVQIWRYRLHRGSYPVVSLLHIQKLEIHSRKYPNQAKLREKNLLLKGCCSCHGGIGLDLENPTIWATLSFLCCTARLKPDWYFAPVNLNASQIWNQMSYSCHFERMSVFIVLFLTEALSRVRQLYVFVSNVMNCTTVWLFFKPFLNWI